MPTPKTVYITPGCSQDQTEPFRAIVAELAATESPTYDSESGDRFCFFGCDYQPWEAGEHEGHADECLWVRAKALAEASAPALRR